MPLKLTCCLAHIFCSSLVILLLMPSLGCPSVPIIFHKQLHQFSTPKMKISKAPELLKRAVTVLRTKAEVLHTKLLILAALRRSSSRVALVGAVSRRIHALVSSDGRRREKRAARVGYGDDRALVPRKAKAVAVAASQEPAAAADRERDGVIDPSEVALFQEDGHSFPDWTTRSLFDGDDDDCYGDDDEDAHDGRRDDYGVADVLNEPSVMDIIRSNREVEGLEFNMDEEIDEACDMFIRRFRNRMNRSF